MTPDMPLAIGGPGRDVAPPATVMGTPAATIAAAGKAANVAFDGFVFLGGVKCIVTTGTAALSVTYSTIQNGSATQAGVDSSTCTIALDSNIIGPSNTGGGVR